MKTNNFIFFTVIFFLAGLSNFPYKSLAQRSDSTRARSPNRWFPSQIDPAAELEKKILCGFAANGLSFDPRQKSTSDAIKRAKYLSSILSQQIVRLTDPQWRDIQTQHIISQIIAETGTLSALSEGWSEYASSRKLHKGRGACQTTHKENYAKLAGCAEMFENNPPPEPLSQKKIAQAPQVYNSIAVKAPAEAMNEITPEGQFLNALSCVCYFVDTAERYPVLEAAMKCSTMACVDNVGVALNKGPGKLGQGAKPLNSEGRRSAFKKMNRCFSN